MNQVNPVSLTWGQHWVRDARSLAPHSVVIRNVSILSDGPEVALFVGLGAVNTLIENVRVRGSHDVQVYLEAESTHTRLIGLEVWEDGDREAVAIDSSDYGIMERSVVHGHMLMFRNCGELGGVRHTTSSYWVFDSNVIDTTIVSARDSQRLAYCQRDNMHPVGSGLSDYSHSRGNTFVNHTGDIMWGISAF